MRKRTFQQRIKRSQEVGNLTIADLSRWFDRPYQTVRYWSNRGSEPGGGPVDQKHAEAMLNLLETLIDKRKGFPMPRLSQQDRIAHLGKIREAALS